jgi:hypothetical protein
MTALAPGHAAFRTYITGFGPSSVQPGEDVADGIWSGMDGRERALWEAVERAGAGALLPKMCAWLVTSRTALLAIALGREPEAAEAARGALAAMNTAGEPEPRREPGLSDSYIAELIRQRDETRRLTGDADRAARTGPEAAPAVTPEAGP